MCARWAKNSAQGFHEITRQRSLGSTSLRRDHRCTCEFVPSLLRVSKSCSQNLPGRGWDATDENGELVTPDPHRVRHAEKDRTSERRPSEGPKTLGKRKAVIEGLSRTMPSDGLFTSLPSWTRVGFHSDKQVFSFRSETGLEVVAPYRDASDLPKKNRNRNPPTPDTSDASSSCQASVPCSWRDHYYTYIP